MLKFICYIEVYFAIVLLDCVCYNEDFNKSTLVKSRFCSINVLLKFWSAEENSLLYQGLHYLAVR